jgi:4-amino-4-deoxy-L-arabinose transferase-like glycosyltransferase
MSTTSAEATLPLGHGFALELRRFKRWAPLAALLGLTGGLYLWGLSRNGYANSYYAAAVQAGTHSWTAFLFGSLDAANYITVDKPPASLWLMELSSRVFGFSSFSMLLPQALEGIGAVALLYATVKRWFGRLAALLSGLILALTPVAALMFRFNNPDALLVLLLVAAAYSLTRALEVGSSRWLAVVGALLGFAFLTKELQAFLVLPAFALVYLLAAPVSRRRRLWQLLLAGGVLVASAGWWVALVELWPVSARPYIGGSTDNSLLNLIFGYNGLERISNADGGGGFSGAPGPLRLFNSIVGGQINWLLPAAAIALAAGAVWTARRPRSDRTRAAVLLWGGWLVVSAAVYSFMTGVIHPYYTNTLAPAIAATVGVGATLLWRRRGQLGARVLLAAMLIASAVWSYVLLDRTPDWIPWLRYAIVLGALGATAGILAAGKVKEGWRPALVTVGLLAALAGPAAYTLSTVATANTGSTPSAGPAAGSAVGFPGGGPAGRPAGAPRELGTSRALASLLGRSASRYTWAAATSSAQTAASLELASGKSVMAIGGFSGGDPAITLARFEALVREGKIHYYVAGSGFGGGLRGFGGSPGERAPGGSSGGRPPGGSPGERPPSAGVLPGVGGAGFGPRGGVGSGAFAPPSGTFRAGGASGPGGGQRVAGQIQSWVSAHFKSTIVGGARVYDLTAAK